MTHHSFKEFHEVQNPLLLPFNAAPDKSQGGGETITFLSFAVKKNSSQSPKKNLFAMFNQNTLENTMYLDFQKALGPFLRGILLRDTLETRRLLNADDLTIEDYFPKEYVYNGPKKGEIKNHTPTATEWYMLNQLRINAGSPERSLHGIKNLGHYYSQLVYMEEKFQFSTNETKIMFCWFESFSGHKVETECIQYEKASVLYNMAAIYSQLGAQERKWTRDGKQKAALYFQKSAGIFLYIRDIVCPRFSVKLPLGSDLTQDSLTASATAMLAQAAECFYEKANDQGNSSHVTSLVAIYCSDLYDVAGRQAQTCNAFNTLWMDYLKTKHNLFGAIAHFHTGPSASNDRVVAERLTRLQVARELVKKAVQISKKIGGVLENLSESYKLVIENAIECLDTANSEIIKNTPYDARLLSPLRRPPEALVNPLPLTDVAETQDVLESVIAPAQYSSIQKVLVESLEISTGYQKKFNEIQDSVKSKITKLQILIGTLTATNFTNKIKEEANLLVGNIQKFQLQENFISILELLKCLEKICNYLDHNIDFISAIFDPIRGSGVEGFNEALMLGIHNDLKCKLDFLKRIKLQLEKKYYQDVVPFTPMSWTFDKLSSIIPFISVSADKITTLAKERDSEIHRLEIQLGLILEHQKTLGGEIESKLKTLIDLENDSWTKKHGLMFQKAVDERREDLKKVEDNMKKTILNGDGIITKLNELLQGAEKQLESTKDVMNQKEICNNFSNGIQVCLAYREQLLQQVQIALVFREISAKVIGTNLKYDFDDLLSRSPRDPMINRLRNIDTKWKPLDISALEKTVKDISGQEIKKALFDAYILPLDDPSPLKKLHEKVSGHLEILPEVLFEDELLPSAPRRPKHPMRQPSAPKLAPGSKEKQEDASPISKVFKVFREGVSKFVSSPQKKAPRVSSFGNKNVNPFDSESRKSSYASAIEMESSVSTTEQMTSHDYFKELAKENARLRAAFSKIQKANESKKPTRIHQWLKEQRKIVKKRNESEVSLEDADPNTASLAAAVAVGVRAAQRVIIKKRKPPTNNNGATSSYHVNSMKIQPETESQLKNRFTREDSGYVKTPREGSSNDLGILYLR